MSPVRQWIRPMGLSLVIFGMVLAPWVGFNLGRFEKSTTVSSTFGLTVLTANCHGTYHGPLLGYTDLSPECVPPDSYDEEPSVRDARLRDRALTYMSGNVKRFPLVVAARTGRVWYAFRVGQTIELASADGRPQWAEWLGALSTWILVGSAVAGSLNLRRRDTPIWPVIAPVAAVLLSLVIVSGVPRYRAAAEPSLVILAGVAMSSWLDRFRRATRPEQVDNGAPLTPALSGV
jgi:hypothetical protein